jgi:predicted HicB family RNase H-like nuclease
MNHRPTIQFRFRDEPQKQRFAEEAKRAGVSLNEYILRKLEGPKLDISRRKI